MKYEIEHDETYTILTIQNEKLDSEIAPDLKSQLIILTNSDEQNDLIMDLSHVSFADSSGLSSLLLANRLYRDNDRKILLCNVGERVQKLIDISQLTSTFTITDSRDDAITQITG